MAPQRARISAQPVGKLGLSDRNSVVNNGPNSVHPQLPLRAAAAVGHVGPGNPVHHDHCRLQHLVDDVAKAAGAVLGHDGVEIGARDVEAGAVYNGSKAKEVAYHSWMVHAGGSHLL